MWEVSTWGAIAEVVWWGIMWWILSYFWLTAEWLMILTWFLLLDVIFWLVDSYIVSKDTSSSKLVEWLAKKFWRWLLPFICILALKWVWYESVETISNVVMSILIISEWYSIVWHIYSINYKESLPEIDALKILIQKISEIFKLEIFKKNKKVDLDNDSNEQG